ncbi:NADP-dependent oxidoreductase [Clostridium swellfunianum]|uniref:quinone oxidoreductase family protein n=1 Tax=Clostridium swellfunianum TaxID=1367462 RepID=UPI00202EB8A1|nr:NADP-dependent oxidoreductase [Clostridium swellfunianum]MCM0648062.1 NADP-dependent oxidoreductase [Clostridium swellfunianum]
MKAVVLDRFGGPSELVMRNIPVSDVEPEDVLIRVEYAGVGQWDIFEREGGYAEMLGMKPNFPYVVGSEGAGTVVRTGGNVTGFNIGDKVYASGFLNPKGGFYSEYVVVESKYVSHIPECITIKEASAILGVGITALRGLEDILKLKQGEAIIIVGASGGVGHLAVQIAKNKGARVFAVASGDDGVDMVRSLGIDTVVDGYKDDILLAAKSFAPAGFDAALITTGGEIAEIASKCVRTRGNIAYPNGIYPVPKAHSEVSIVEYNGEPDSDIINRLNDFVKQGILKCHIDQVFLLKDAYEAHIALSKHYLGKLCLRID